MNFEIWLIRWKKWAISVQMEEINMSNCPFIVTVTLDLRTSYGDLQAGAELREMRRCKTMAKSMWLLFVVFLFCILRILQGMAIKIKIIEFIFICNVACKEWSVAPETFHVSNSTFWCFYLLIPKICTVLVLAKTSFRTSAEFED